MKARVTMAVLGLCVAAAQPAAAQDGFAGVDSLLASGRYEAAAAALRAIPRASEKDARPAYYEGRVLMGQRKFDQAESRFESAMRLDPAAAEYRYWAGLAAHERMEAAGMLGKARLARRAISRFREAVERDADHVEARSWLIQYLWKAPGIIGGDRDEALRQVAELERRDAAQAHRLLGSFRWEEHDYAAVEREYRTVVEWEPGDGQAWYMIGRARQEQEDPVGAATAFETALAADSTHLRAMYYLGRAAVGSGHDVERGEAVVRRFLREGASMGPAWLAGGHSTLGRLLEIQGRTEEAIQAYRTAVTLDPKREEARQRLRALGGSP